MDFLRQHLSGLHQALRGALDSLSSFVSYLMGDEVPTAERREAQAAEELEEVAAGRPRPGRAVEEEAQKALEGLGSSQSQGDGRLRGPRQVGRCQERSSATEQTWGWGEGSSYGSQADKQDTGAWEAATATRCQQPRSLLETRKKSEAVSEAHQDRSSPAQESQEPNEQEMNRGETLRTWEQEEEEEEEVRAGEPRVARGAEPEWTWHREPEEKASTGGQKVAGDIRQSEQVVKEAVAEEIQGPGTKGAVREEEVAVVARVSQSIRAPGSQEPGTESEDGATKGREEAGTTSCGEEAGSILGREEARVTPGREEAGSASGGEEARMTSDEEEADLPRFRETEYGIVPGERISKDIGRVWTLEEASKGDQEEVDENREAEINLFPKRTQALGTEGMEKAAKDQTAGREAAKGQGSEEEVGEDFEAQADEGWKEAVERQDSEVRAVQASLEDLVQAEEAKEEEESCWTAEAELLTGRVTSKAYGNADLEATPEARPEKEFSGERIEEEAQTYRESFGVEGSGLKQERTEGQEPELMGCPQTPTEQPKEGQGGKEKPWNIPALSKEQMERSLEEYPRNMGYTKPDTFEAEAWENWRRDMEREDIQKEKADAEGEEGAVGGQAQEAEAEGGRESALPDVLESGGGYKVAECEAEEGEASGAEFQDLGGRCGAEAGTGQSLGESDARETKNEEVVPWGANRTFSGDQRLEEVSLSLQDSKDTWASSLASVIVEDKAAQDGRAAGAGEAWGVVFGTTCDSEGREEAEGGGKLVEAAEGEDRGGQGFGLEGSEEEVTGRGGRAGVVEGDPGNGWAEVGESAVAQGSCRMDGFTLGSRAVGAEGTKAIMEAERQPGGQMLLEKEAGKWQVREQGQGSQGQCGDHHAEGEARRPPDVEDVKVTGDQRAEAEDTDPEGLEDIQDQEDQSTSPDPAEAVPGPGVEASGGAHGDAHSSWSEALLPGSRLDVSAPWSRVLLSRCSSQRRSRPSFQRGPASEQQEEPPSPPLAEKLSVSEQGIFQPEEPPEPSPPRPEGTPVPTRRRLLGHGFGLAHPSMMQELQARLGQPKPQ
ncbi:Apolipoprotein B Receptor [Manis pentadactyla]|nr:Apolipoprotein B Receptor [Manis pentadactyla]